MQTTQERLATLCFDEETPLSSQDLQGIIQRWIEDNNRVFHLHCATMAMTENWEFLHTIYANKLHTIDPSIARDMRTYLLDYLVSGEIQPAPLSCQQPDFQGFLNAIADKTLGDIFHHFFIEKPQFLNISYSNQGGIVDDAKCNAVFKTGNKILQIAALLDVRQQLERLLCANVKMDKFMVQGQNYINTMEQKSLVGHSLFPAAPANPVLPNQDNACCCALF